MQTDDVKEFLGVSSSSGKTKVVVCGSPNEVANDISKGDTGLTMTLRNEIDGLWGHSVEIAGCMGIKSNLCYFSTVN